MAANTGDRRGVTRAKVAKARKYLKGDWKEQSKALHAVIPSEVGLARYMGVPAQTLQFWTNKKRVGARWDKNYDELVGILSEIKDLQHDILVNNGLAGNFQHTICRLILGKHGYNEKQHVVTTNADDFKSALDDEDDDE